MPAGFDPAGDFALREQTSIEPVHRFSRIVAAMLLAPPGMIVQWLSLVAGAMLAEPPGFRPIDNRRRGGEGVTKQVRQMHARDGVQERRGSYDII
jgi:hypothetical protein